LYSRDNITLEEGRGNTFIMFFEERKDRRLLYAENSRQNSGLSEKTIPEGQTGTGFPFSSTL
jgi:hypothetical protein